MNKSSSSNKSFKHAKHKANANKPLRKTNSSHYASVVSQDDETSTISRRSLLQKPIHSDSVTCIELVRLGLIVSGSADKTIVLSNYDTSERLRVWCGHEREVTKVCYDNTIQNQFVASGSRDATIRIWPLNDSAGEYRNSCSKTLVGHEMVVSGVAIIDGISTQICSGSRDNSVKLWDVETGTCILTKFIAQNLVTHLSWSKAERYLAQTSEDKELRMWDPRQMEIIHCFPKTTHIQSHCDVSLNGLSCLTSTNGFNSNGCELMLWDMRQRSLVSTLKGHEQSVNAAKFVTYSSHGAANNKTLLISVSTDHTVKLWDADDKRCLWTESVPTAGSLLSVAACNDGSVIVGGQNSCIAYMKIVEEYGKLFLSPQSLQVMLTRSGGHR